MQTPHARSQLRRWTGSRDETSDDYTKARSTGTVHHETQSGLVGFLDVWIGIER